MNCVYFLGAGFSKRFGMPIMTDFFPFARNNIKMTDNDKSLINELILEARNANSFMQSSTTNLEDILSFAIMGERLNVTKNAISRSKKLVKILQKLYTYYNYRRDYWNQYKPSLSTFFGISSNSDPLENNNTFFNKFKESTTFITTNYDINIESMLYSANIKTFPGFPLKHIEINEFSKDNYYDELGIPLYKLHGSVNWFKSKQNYLVDDFITLNKPFNSTVPHICSERYDSIEIPQIIPPSFLKPDLSQISKKIWQAASKAFNQADYVVFIGYSFPLTDNEMKYFFSKSLANNPNIDKIFIIDPFANKIIQRLQDNLNGFGNQFKELLTPINKKWQDVNLRNELSHLGIKLDF